MYQPPSPVRRCFPAAWFGFSPRLLSTPFQCRFRDFPRHIAFRYPFGGLFFNISIFLGNYEKYHYTRNISLKRKEQNSMNPLDIIKNPPPMPTATRTPPPQHKPMQSSFAGSTTKLRPMNRTNATPFFKRYSALAAPWQGLSRVFTVTTALISTHTVWRSSTTTV